jgi:F-type H+-transporting ATPase subunit gamma
METLELVKRQIDRAEDLMSIVKTMKALAAVSIRQYEQALRSLAEYHRTTEMGLQVVFANQPRDTREGRSHVPVNVGCIVFGSDQGMCGQFNERITTYTLKSLQKLHLSRNKPFFVGMGVRAIASLEEVNQVVDQSFSMPGSVAGITPLVQQLLLVIDQWRGLRQVDTVYLFYNRYLTGATYRPHLVRLLPIEVKKTDPRRDAWQSRSLPIYSMDSDRLLSALIRQRLFVLLYRAFTESLASENASRLASMQNAEKNIEERQAELEKKYHEQRQGQITSELLDISSGFEALSTG